MALRRSRGHRGGDGNQVKGLADRIASATKPEPSGGAEAAASSVLAPGLTRYQRQTANLPSGAKQMTVAELTNIVVDLRDETATPSDEIATPSDEIATPSDETATPSDEDA